MPNGTSATAGGSGSAGVSAVASGTAGRTHTDEDVQRMVKERLSRQAQSLARKHEAELAELQGKVLSEEERKVFEQLRKEAEERKKQQLKDKGDFDKYVQEQHEKHEKQLTEEREKAAKEKAELKSQLVRYNIDSKLRQLASEAGTLPEKVDQVVRLLKTAEETGFKLTLNDKGEIEFEPVTGGEALDKDGAPLTPDRYVQRFLDNNKHFLRADMRDGGAGISDTDTTTRGAKARLNPFQVKAAKAAGLKVEDVEKHQPKHIKP